MERVSKVVSEKATGLSLLRLPPDLLSAALIKADSGKVCAIALRSLTNWRICSCLTSSSGALNIEDGCTVAVIIGPKSDF